MDPHDGISQRLRVQFDLRRPFPGGDRAGKADAGRWLGVRGGWVRQRAPQEKMLDRSFAPRID
jgi:hypothetical protein